MDTKEIAACVGKMIIFIVMILIIIMMTIVLTNMAAKIIFTMIMSINMTWTPWRLPPTWVRSSYAL